MYGFGVGGCRTVILHPFSKCARSVDLWRFLKSSQPKPEILHPKPLTLEVPKALRPAKGRSSDGSKVYKGL